MSLFPELEQKSSSSLFPELEEKKSSVMDMVSNAIGQTPLGMAAQGAGQAADLISKPLLPVGRELGAPLSAITTRPGRALGVAAAEMAGPGGNTPQSIQNAVKSAQEAYQVGYQPQTPRQMIGSAIGEGGALAGLGMIPGIGPELATAAGISSGVEKTGGLSIGDVLSAGAIGATNVPRIANSMGLVKRLTPSLLKSQKGIPLEVTKMALEDPSIINQKIVPGAIKDKVQDIINTFHEARKKVGEEFGKTYLDETGLPNPVDEFIADLPEYKSVTQNQSYQTPGVSFGGVNPKEPTGIGPTGVGQSQTINTVPTRDPGPNLDQLKSQYQDALNGSFLRNPDQATGSYTNLSNKDALAKLTQLKRNLMAFAEYNPEGVEVGKSRGVQNTGIQKMAAQIDEIRGKIPGGEKLAVADDAYNEMKAIKNQLQTVLKDTGSQQDYLNRIIKGNIDWLTAGRNGQKIEAIKRIEELTGKEVLKPALQQMAIAYIQNPDILSLPSFQTSKFFANFIPTNKILDAASKFEKLGSNKMGRRYSVAPLSMGLLKGENQ